MSRVRSAVGAVVVVATTGASFALPLLAGCAGTTGGAHPDSAASAGALPSRSSVPARSADPGVPSPDDFVTVDKLPVMIIPPKPVYPEWARLTAAVGVVVVRALVGRDGRVAECFAVSGMEELREAALVAVKGAAFEPAERQGERVSVWIQMPIRFSMH